MENEKRKFKYIKSNEQFKLLIPGYPEGSDLTIVNTAYIGRTKNDETGEWAKDYICILYRDNNTGTKKTYIIQEPLYTFFVIDESKKNVPSHNLFFIEKEYVKPVTCKFTDILKCIAEITGNLSWYNENVSNGNSSENKKLHTLPNVFMSDMNIENYYRFLFQLSYTNNTFKLSKGYFDIETDGRFALGDFPEPGEVPINAIAYCDEATNTTYQFLLNDLKNPLLQDYKRAWENGFVLDELKKFVINAVGGPKKAIKYGVDQMDYKIIFFDNELDLITTMFKIVNYLSPDFLMIWNMAFDLNYIITRITELGANPADIICDHRIPIDFLRFYIDEKNRNNYEERGDFVNISSYTVWLDQMIQFASRRKGRGRFQSFKLDAIGEVIADVRKLDYSHITKDINALPMLNYKVFSFYNVMDVIVQKCIEKMTQDCEYVFTKCLVNNTIYAKCHRQSVYLANRFAKDFYEYGYIIGNNKNLWNEKPSVKFPGAMVGNPLHNDPDITVKINNKPSLLVDNCVDFDYSSLYPSIILENNLAPNTQIGKIIIEDPDNPDRVYSLNEHQDMFSSDEEVAKYSRGGEFLDNFMSGNILEFCRRWLGLGDVFDILNDIEEYYSYNKQYGLPLYGQNNSIYYTKDKMINAIIIEDNPEYSMRPALSFYDTLDNNMKNELVDKIKLGAIL